jgi:hypothetical protein
MTKEDIIRMAREAGLFTHKEVQPELERFANLVAAAEREEITKMLNYLDMKAQPYHNYYRHAAVEINREEGEGELI